MCFSTEISRRAPGYSFYSCIYASGGSSERRQALFDYAALLRGHRATLCLHISQVGFLGVWQFFSMTGCQRTFFSPSVRRISEARTKLSILPQFARWQISMFVIMLCVFAAIGAHFLEHHRSASWRSSNNEHLIVLQAHGRGVSASPVLLTHLELLLLCRNLIGQRLRVSPPSPALAC